MAELGAEASSLMNKLTAGGNPETLLGQASELGAKASSYLGNINTDEVNSLMSKYSIGGVTIGSGSELFGGASATGGSGSGSGAGSAAATGGSSAAASGSGSGSGSAAATGSSSGSSKASGSSSGSSTGSSSASGSESAGAAVPTMVAVNGIVGGIAAAALLL